MLAAVALALVIAGVLAALGRASGQPGLLRLAVAWALYACWELLMFRRVLCSGECNIRVDLLLIAPALLLCTLWVALGAWRRRRSPR